MTNVKIILIKRITKYKTVEGTKTQLFFFLLYTLKWRLLRFATEASKKIVITGLV